MTDYPKTIFDFVEAEYSQERKLFWESLTRYVKEQCERELKRIGVQANVIYRVKEKESLQEKLCRRWAKSNMENENQRYCTSTDILNDLLDIGGVRVSIYFPNQHLPVEGILRNPAWIKETVLRSFDEHNYIPSDKDIRSYEERFAYYHARHFYVRLLETPELHGAIPPLSKYADERVEVQVRTVFMDAWAEVRHNLVYKVLGGQSHLSREELRILDGIKGLVTTGELLLEHLHTAHNERLRADARKFPDGENFEPTLLQALNVRHVRLVEKLDTGTPAMMQTLQTFLARVGVETPKALKEKLADLKSQQRIDEEIAAVGRFLGKDLMLPQFLTYYISKSLPHSHIDLATYSEMTRMRVCDYEDWYYLRALCLTISDLVEKTKPCDEEIAGCSIIWNLHEWMTLLIYGTRESDLDNFVNPYERSSAVPRIRGFMIQLRRYLQEPPMSTVQASYFATITKLIYNLQYDERAWYPDKWYESLSPSLKPWFRTEDYLIAHSHVELPVSWLGSREWSKGLEIASEIVGESVKDINIATLYRSVCSNNTAWVEKLLQEPEIYSIVVQEKQILKPTMDFKYKLKFTTSVWGAASKFAGVDVVRLLLEAGCVKDINEENIYIRRTALHAAVIRQELATVRLLLSQKNICVDAEDWTDTFKKPRVVGKILPGVHGISPLEFALAMKQAEVADLLISHPETTARLHFKDWAVWYSFIIDTGFDKELIAKIVERAHWKVRDKNGLTLWDFFEKEKKLELLERAKRNTPFYL
jgi:ppGpp synthetase/RelA/SpoT-type nucleotidyltranferase